MLRRFPSICCLLVVAACALAGCGSPDEVTYVDPNGNAGLPTNPGAGDEPVRVHGVAALERALALIRIRAALTTARAIHDTKRPGAAAVLARAVDEDLPFLEARTAASDPALARSLRLGLERLRDAGPAAADFGRRTERLVTAVLPRVEMATVGSAARQDAAFRADLLYETLQQAGTAYESALEGGLDAPAAAAEYQLAYGLLRDAATRQLDALGEPDRALVRRRIDAVIESTAPTPALPDPAREAEEVVDELGSLADEVAERAGIDPTYPPPDTNAPDQLRALKRAVAAAVEAVERDAPDDALRQLTAADRSIVTVSASSIAAVAPELLASLERSLLVDLPAAIRSDGDVAAVAAELDTRIDEAISLLEEELEALRESE